jgi:methylenetetrahydrofolate dehydrogenase (NADP+) / methenyltetrahydrofolate cyclohydrolase
MIIDGRVLAEEVLTRTKVRAEKLGRRPRVVVYVAGEPTPATRSYLKIKKRSAESAGCDFVEQGDISTFTTADAGIIQLPVPKELGHILDTIPVNKDADVLSCEAREKFERGDAGALLPPVVGAIVEIFEKYGVPVAGKNVVVVGAGFLVGAPSATWLKQQGAVVEVATSKTEDLPGLLKSADIIISGAGSPHLIKPEMLKDGVVLIDAGTSESGGVLAGDVDPACAPKCSLLTPVPGGIGPLAVAKLFENAVTLTERATHL